MRRFGALLSLLLLLLPASAQAEQVYVHNKPFKGAMSGKGDGLLVDLEAMAKEFGASVNPVNGGWYVTSKPFQADQMKAEAKQVVVEGTPIESQPGPSGEVMVPLKALGQALGLRVTRNAGLGTIDVYAANKPVAAEAPAAKATAQPAAAPPPPAGVIHANRPGAAIDLASAVVKGKINIVAFDAEW